MAIGMLYLPSFKFGAVLVTYLILPILHHVRFSPHRLNIIKLFNSFPELLSPTAKIFSFLVNRYVPTVLIARFQSEIFSRYKWGRET